MAALGCKLATNADVGILVGDLVRWFTKKAILAATFTSVGVGIAGGMTSRHTAAIVTIKPASGHLGWLDHALP